MEFGADEVVEVNCARGGSGGGDPGVYAAVLKRKLDLYCAAVAKTMEAKPQESALGAMQLVSQASDTSQLVSQASFDGDGTVVQGKPANSCTSREQSDVDGDLEENTDPANAKRVKRMLSNRESARRSRKRKQAHQTDIESQVTQLRAENASLLKRLTDMTQKYKEATLGNRNLTVDMETMRRKVNIAEEAVRRVTGASLLFSITSDMAGSSVPFSSCISDAASADAAPTEESMSHLLQGFFEDDQIKPDLPQATTPVVPSGEEMASRPASLRRIASLENLQQRIHGDSIHSDTASAFSDHEFPENAL
ncbi:light-inducible protein CPRF2 [Brachypodium distachyon]|uniref:BZIP domain-containing protein n=1 Tax=Brachypodium distachyon TaxID=15368 RepID=I1IGR5_BRADI|nr:light-inducible protein CPRF2 [Brachypodium distachyon]KQJ85957.1 hypothetical protein BRADI_4g02570v3 [Brachypodium distachyon]|eukprot:XP_003577778.1 light-inducible protein CPRF2 [Brachypodium distachyon]